MKKRLLILFLSYFLIMGISNIFNNSKSVNQDKKISEILKSKNAQKSKDDQSIKIQNKKESKADQNSNDEDHSMRVDEEIEGMFEGPGLVDNYGR
jgi:hypothetical protein